MQDLETEMPIRNIPGFGSAVFTSADQLDRKSTRLNSSHSQISYAVFCLNKEDDLRYFFGYCLDCTPLNVAPEVLLQFTTHATLRSASSVSHLSVIGLPAGHFIATASECV